MLRDHNRNQMFIKTRIFIKNEREKLNTFCNGHSFIFLGNVASLFKDINMNFKGRSVIQS
jgi:hypothetical protein